MSCTLCLLSLVSHGKCGERREYGELPSLRITWRLSGRQELYRKSDRHFHQKLFRLAVVGSASGHTTALRAAVLRPPPLHRPGGIRSLSLGERSAAILLSSGQIADWSSRPSRGTRSDSRASVRVRGSSRVAYRRGGDGGRRYRACNSLVIARFGASAGHVGDPARRRDSYPAVV